MDSHSSESEDWDSDSEIKEYEEKGLAELKKGLTPIKNVDGTLRCPFCIGKKKQGYKYKDLLQHANGIGAGRRGAETTGQHRALENYLKTDLAHEAEPPVKRIIHLEQDTPERPNSEELIVWPWMGIIVNMTRTLKDGKYVGAGNGELKERFSEFHPCQVHVLWNYEGHLGKAVLDFGTDFNGYHDAFSFERSFAMKHKGKKDYYEGCLGSELYGWVARADDFNSRCPVGKFLRSKGDLKTVAEVHAEEMRKKNKLVEDLHNTIEKKNKVLQNSLEQVSKLEYQISIKELARQKAEEEKRILEAKQKQELKRFEEERNSLIQRQNEEVLRMSRSLADQMALVEERQKDLDRREAQTELEKMKLEDDKKKLYERKETLEKANRLQKHYEEEHRKLIEKHEKENKDLSIQLHLERKRLAERQKLELEIQGIQTHLHTIKQVKEDSDVPVNSDQQRQLNELEDELKDKSDELESLQDMNQQLMTKERIVNDELQDARKAALKFFPALGDQNSNTQNSNICVKRMGEMDSGPWKEACQKKFNRREWEEKYLELYSLWDDHLRDPSWHPFKVQCSGDKCEQVVNENDEKLAELKASLGNAVCNSVITALNELNEYNASGRYPIPELWNVKENRRATLAEIVGSLGSSRPQKKRRM